MSFFFMTRKKKYLSSSSSQAFVKPEEESLTPRPGRILRLVTPSSSGHLWKCQVSPCSHTCASPCSALFTERNQLGSSLLLIFLWPGLLEPSRGKCKWPTGAFVQDSLLKLRKREKKVKLLSHVGLCNPVDCSLPGSFVHGIRQARILEWVAISFSRGSC